MLEIPKASFVRQGHPRDPSWSTMPIGFSFIPEQDFFFKTFLMVSKNLIRFEDIEKSPIPGARLSRGGAYRHSAAAAAR